MSPGPAAVLPFCRLGKCLLVNVSLRGGKPGRKGWAPTLTKFVPLLSVTRVQRVQEDNATFPEGRDPAARPHCE